MVNEMCHYDENGCIAVETFGELSFEKSCAYVYKLTYALMAML